jgi:hypothetical protein
MTDKPLKSLNGKKFTGPLAAPIDTGIIFPLGLPKDRWQEYIDKNYDELHRQRVAKVPYLARHLGIQFEHLDLSSDAGLIAFYGCIVENLARLLIPGFQEKNDGKWPPAIVLRALGEVERGKRLGEYASDLEGCKYMMTLIEPDLALPRNRTRLKQRARTLENRVSKLRVDLKRKHAAKQLHKKPRLRIVK